MNRRRHKKKPGFTLVELLIVITIIGILIGLLLPVLAAAMATTNRMACAANLSSIGKAIATYASRYRGAYPTVYQYGKPPTNSTNIDETMTQAWADNACGYASMADFDLPDWVANPAGTTANHLMPFRCNLSCLFLLVRSGDANEGLFKCPADPSYQPDTIQDAQTHWSFRFITNCSYSYQNQIYDSTPGINGGGQNTNQNTVDPAVIVAADMNPSRYLDMAHPPSELPPAIVQWGVSRWNSPNHKYQGQNCLYADGHVTFNDTPFCGYGQSNIWTRGSYTLMMNNGGTATGSWSNSDPRTPSAGGGGSPPDWCVPYGGAPISGGLGCGTSDKCNTFLVP